MDVILVQIKKIIPQALFKALQPTYHLIMNFLAALRYGFPSEKMIVIGVTGTTGKTTVVYMLAQVLQSAGMKVGYTSTALFGDGDKEWLNDKKMTMLGRFFTQGMLSRMVRNGCDVAIVETTSEGAVQFRHRYINYDVFVFTGIYPEHIDSHGSFENYKNAKKSLFAHIAQCKKKNLTKKTAHFDEVLEKTIVVHGDDGHAGEFLDFPVAKKIVFASENVMFDSAPDAAYLYYELLESNATGIKIGLDTSDVQLNLLGEFTVTNAAAAAAAARAIGVSQEAIKKGLEKIVGVPGRLERIREGQDFEVIVDYAFEPVAVAKLYETVAVLTPERIIHVLGSTGGGRDIARREMLGEIAGKRSDIVIVTNEDPYDDDPMEIIQGVAKGASRAGKEKERNLFLIEDRAQAIEKALSLAEKGDIVLITGKGSEQAIAVADGRHIPWDDREVARTVLQSL